MEHIGLLKSNGHYLHCNALNITNRVTCFQEPRGIPNICVPLHLKMGQNIPPVNSTNHIMHLRFSIDDMLQQHDRCNVKSYQECNNFPTFISARELFVPNQLLSSLSPPAQDRAIAVMIGRLGVQGA